MSNTVLILDDDPGVRDLVANSLRDDGYEVIQCGNMGEFLQNRNRQDINLYIIDVKLPDADGMQITRELRGNTDAGIIMLTGSGEEIDRVLGLELGADDYVTKPFRVRELRARIKAVMRRIQGPHKNGQEAAATAVEAKTQRIHDFRINRASRTVQRESGDMVDLTTLEFDLLSILASHVNVVLSRDQIMDHLRGPNWSVYDRSIDGLISRLRSKLFKDDEGRHKIKTVRNIGYMLVGDN